MNLNYYRSNLFKRYSYLFFLLLISIGQLTAAVTVVGRKTVTGSNGRDIAGKFNQTYGETFVIPEPRIRDEVAAVPGTDGQKMSKSYDNTIEIFGAEKPLRKKVMRLVMDSRPPEEPKPDAEKNIAIQLLKLFATQEIASETENKLREGGLGYGDLKKTLFEHYWEYFTEARTKRAELENNLDYVNQVLQGSAEKARALASTVVDRAKKNCGLS